MADAIGYTRIQEDAVIQIPKMEYVHKSCPVWLYFLLIPCKIIITICWAVLTPFQMTMEYEHLDCWIGVLGDIWRM